MLRRPDPKLSLLFLVTLAATCPRLGAELFVSLEPSRQSPAPVGAIVNFAAQVNGADESSLRYRFGYRDRAGIYHVIKDYGPSSDADWTAAEHEGMYLIEVSVRNLDSGETAAATVPFQMLSNAIGSQPAINSTDHPLVFLYSAPPCPPGSRMSVRFRLSDGGAAQTTPSKPCEAGLSMNFFLAGLLPATEYSASHIIQTGATLQEGPALTFTTGDIPINFAWQAVRQPPLTNAAEGIVLQGPLYSNPLATDLDGNVIWYYPGVFTFFTRPVAGGYFFGIIETFPGDTSQQVLRMFDLAGMTVLETNAATINEQLAALGKRPISGFHHEARRLPDGKILTLASVEQILTDVQGPGAVDVVGDMILVLSPDLEVLWTWDAFDHLDPSRKATLNDACGRVSCPPLYLASAANDWLHSNAVALTPDGHLLLSMRSQDWLVKIDYANGNGSGEVIWRLGKEGDFQFDSDDPYPWFSHQHDAQFISGDPSLLLLFDNGNTRIATDANANSRGQVIRLDEVNRVARLVLNADLGQYSVALGSAQRLASGNYHFDVGLLSDSTSISVEVDDNGNPVYALQAGAPAYRTFRMRDLYTPE